MAYGNVKVDSITTSTKTVTVDNLLDGANGSITSAMIADGAIVNADINTSAAIAYSKLSLSNSVVNADISSSAAIADSKLATISTGGKVSGTAITSGNMSTSGSIATTSTLAVGQSSAAANTDLDVNGAYAGNVVAVGALDINCSTGNYFTKTISSNSTFTFSNVPSSRAYSFTLEVDHNGGTISWPAAVKWPDDTAPTLTTGKTHIFIFVTDNGGTRWRGVAAVDFVD